MKKNQKERTPSCDLIYKYIGCNIANIRRSKNMTQDVLADKAGVSKTRISNLESLSLSITTSIEFLNLIADALEVPLWKLFYPVNIDDSDSDKPKEYHPQNH